MQTLEGARSPISAPAGRAPATLSVNDVLRGAVTGYVLAAATVILASVLLAADWMNLPFLGSLFAENLQVTRAVPAASGQGWALLEQDARPGDRLVAMDGQTVTAASARNALQQAVAGDRMSITLSRSGQERSVEVGLAVFPYSDRTAYVLLPTTAALLLVILAGLELSWPPHGIEARAFALLSASFGVLFGCLFDLISSHSLDLAWLFSLSLAGSALLHLSLVVRTRSSPAARTHIPAWLCYVGALAVAVSGLPAILNPATSLASVAAWPAGYGFLLFSAVVYLVTNLSNLVSQPLRRAKLRSGVMAGATILAFAPPTTWWLMSVSGGPGFTPYVVLPLAVLPITLAYFMGLFASGRASEWIGKVMVYLLLSALIVGGYALVVAGLSLVVGRAIQAADPVWLGALALVLALVLDPVRSRLQSMTDRLFFQGRRAATATVAEFTNKLRAALSREEVAEVIRDVVERVASPEALHIFVHDELTGLYTALRDHADRPTTDLRFAATGELASALEQEGGPLLLIGGSRSAVLGRDQTRAEVLDAQFFIPMQSRHRLVGWLALGRRRAGRMYSTPERQILQDLGHQAAIAFVRVETVDGLERRLQEMNTLARVAQGINITLNFDDALELIYSQTAQVVPLSDFRITLRNREEGYDYLAFAVQGAERLTIAENTPLPEGGGLARQVIDSGRAIITRDYRGECLAQGVQPLEQGIVAWMGVPLNAGADTIGALSVGSRDVAYGYTPGQLELLHTIADQTAGAIVKARLLSETQKRTIQLTNLNEFTGQLAGIRETEALRQSVIDGAVKLLGCEAGIFYLADLRTGELTVQTLAGSAPSGLRGHIVSGGMGNASRAAATRRPSIANDLEYLASAFGVDEAAWSRPPRMSMAAPLLFEESMLGVLEVLERPSRGPFMLEDEALLVAFARQAAAALENVRLYTFTDQELAARVEELSIMQRIDRELNASLEMDRAMRVTLEWALRQSGTDAGWVGLIDADRLRVVAELGYGRAISDAVDQTVALTLPGFQPAIETGLPQRVRFDSSAGGGFLAGADHQVVVPVRREAAVIGLLVLESLSTSQEDVGFLGRLSDHAAIAISNAQLYEEVRRANLAKSEFVSLVAHELKNPMTSIKGYTELLAAGSVGSVNEMQAGFLNTIRSNTERMSTLVSDLNDNSKIEAGRLRLEFTSLDLRELVDETVRSAERQFEDKNQAIGVQIAETLPSVWADRTRLAQILTNLISNAHKYTAEGGEVMIGAEPRANQWDPQGARRVVHVWCRDNGIGISPEDQPRIFQKFFRSEDPKAREVTGAGLGLNITRSLVEMQGGQMWFESEYRKGTTFHFTVPVAEA